jgi:hypothetical protein
VKRKAKTRRLRTRAASFKITVKDAPAKIEIPEKNFASVARHAAALEIVEAQGRGGDLLDPDRAAAIGNDIRVGRLVRKSGPDAAREQNKKREPHYARACEMIRRADPRESSRSLFARIESATGLSRASIYRHCDDELRRRRKKLSQATV